LNTTHFFVCFLFIYLFALIILQHNNNISVFPVHIRYNSIDTIH